MIVDIYWICSRLVWCAGFAHGAFEHHAPCDFYGNGLGSSCFAGGHRIGRVSRLQGVVALKMVGEGDALLANGVEFFTAQGNDLVFASILDSSLWGMVGSVMLLCLKKISS